MQVHSLLEYWDGGDRTLNVRSSLEYWDGGDRTLNAGLFIARV